MVGYDAAIGLSEGCDKLAIKVAPGGISVEQNDRVAMTLVHIMHGEAVSLVIVWGKGEGAVKCFVVVGHGMLHLLSRTFISRYCFFAVLSYHQEFYVICLLITLNDVMGCSRFLWSCCGTCRTPQRLRRFAV